MFVKEKEKQLTGIFGDMPIKNILPGRAFAQKRKQPLVKGWILLVSTTTGTQLRRPMRYASQ